MKNKDANKATSSSVMFNYNGYSWNAYEVLGVPEGTSFAELSRIYEDLRSRADVNSKAFLDAAYEALLDQLGSAT